MKRLDVEDLNTKYISIKLNAYKRKLEGILRRELQLYLNRV